MKLTTCQKTRKDIPPKGGAVTANGGSEKLQELGKNQVTTFMLPTQTNSKCKKKQKKKKRKNNRKKGGEAGEI